MLGSIEHDGPVVFLEHKLLADYWLDYLGSGGRTTVSYDVPEAGAKGPVPDEHRPIPLGQAIERREGRDTTLVSLGVGVHRCLEAADQLEADGISAAVIDLRSVSPLDREIVRESVTDTGRLVVVDEDYRDFGLSGELAAALLEAGLDFEYARVCTETTIPYSRELEDQTLPSVGRIVEAVRNMR